MVCVSSGGLCSALPQPPQLCSPALLRALPTARARAHPGAAWSNPCQPHPALTPLLLPVPAALGSSTALYTSYSSIKNTDPLKISPSVAATFHHSNNQRLKVVLAVLKI